MPQCDYCKNEIDNKIRASKIKSGLKCGSQKHGFCSKECRKLYILENTYMLIDCQQCGMQFKKEKTKIGKNNFCSSKCFGAFKKYKAKSKKGTLSVCLGCRMEFLVKKGGSGKFHNTICQNLFKRNGTINNWKSGLHSGMSGSRICSIIRNYIFDKYHHKCSKCGWCQKSQYTNKIPLQIDHINGNYMDSGEDNLQLLCPNCHTLTRNYGSLNRGHGRLGKINYRQERYVLNKNLSVAQG